MPSGLAANLPARSLLSLCLTATASDGSQRSIHESMIVGEAVDDRAVWLAVAESELFSRRFAEGLGRAIPERINERLRYSPPESWSEEDKQAIIDGVRGLPSPALQELARPEARWFAAMLEAPELPELRVAPGPEFGTLAPDGRLVSLVESLRKGRDTRDGQLSGSFRLLSRKFNAKELRGRPCVVAAKPVGPFTIVEGTTRLAVLLARYQRSAPVPLPLPVYLGLHDRPSPAAEEVVGSTGPQLFAPAPILPEPPELAGSSGAR